MSCSLLRTVAQGKILCSIVFMLEFILKHDFARSIEPKSKMDIDAESLEQL